RFVLPTSKLSQSKQQWLTVGPSLSLSRKFAIRSGLVIGYAGRPTYHFNGSTTRVKQPTLAPCLDREQSLQCLEDATTGGRNAQFDFGHGPYVSFSPFE